VADTSVVHNQVDDDQDGRQQDAAHRDHECGIALRVSASIPILDTTLTGRVVAHIHTATYQDLLRTNHFGFQKAPVAQRTARETRTDR